MQGRRLLYLESDGQVYLVNGEGGKWTFPDADADLDFEFDERHETRIDDATVVFARPRLRSHPEHWVFKDRVPGMRDVDPVVRRAINASLARCVVGVVVVDDEGRVLMVKSSRGFTKGMWNIPGGFIEYGEHPEEAAVRELEEETGLHIELGQLLGVWMERFESPYFMYGFMYDGRPGPGKLVLDHDEIAEAKWMPPDRAIASTQNPFAIAAFRRRFRPEEG